MNAFIDRHADKIRGVLSRFERVVITGTLPDLCHAGAMATYLGARNIRLFDYPRCTEPFGDEIRVHADQVAQAHGLRIEFIRWWGTRPFLRCQDKFLLSMPIPECISKLPYVVLPRGRARVISRAPFTPRRDGVPPRAGSPRCHERPTRPCPGSR